MLADNPTRILKFYLHISPDEQLARFKQRLDDPGRNWKISESDIPSTSCGRNTSRPTRMQSRSHAPNTRPGTSFVDHKWFRNLAVSQIIADTMEEMGLSCRRRAVDIADIRRKYHAAKRETRGKTSKASR